MRLRILLTLVSSIILVFQPKNSSASLIINTSAGQLTSSPSEFAYGSNIKSEGYQAVTSYDNGFIAAGSDGRIDWISDSGKITKSEKFPGEEFNSLLSFNQIVIAAGSKGSILISFNKGLFKKVKSGTDKNINSLTLFKEKIIAAADHGEILIGDEKGLFKKIQLALRGNIVSISAEKSGCFGVTDEGEIIHTADGINWDIFDFNKFYDGYYKPCKFTSVLVTENQIAAAGVQNDGLPVLILSTRGKVWTERPLSYTDDHGMISFLKDIPYDIFYDLAINQFILVCSKGKLMTIPSCSHCNELIAFSTEDLKGISANGKKVIIVGENFFFKLINPQ
jgi:hypothetical protein